MRLLVHGRETARGGWLDGLEPWAGGGRLETDVLGPAPGEVCPGLRGDHEIPAPGVPGSEDRLSDHLQPTVTQHLS